MIAFLIVVGYFIFEIFRIPILALLNLRDYGYLLHLTVFVLPLLLMRGVSLKFSRSRYFLVCGLLALVSTIVLFHIGISRAEFSSRLASLFFPFFLPIIIDLFKNEELMWEKIIQKVLKIAFYSGCLYIFVEWLVVNRLGIINQCQLASFLGNERNSQFCDTIRYMPVGFFIYKDMSLAILIGSFLCFKDWDQKTIAILRSCLLVFCVLVVDSITLTGIFVLLSVVRFWSFFRKDLALKITGLLSFGLLLMQSSLYGRVISYIMHEMDLNRFLPAFEQCRRENLLFLLNGAYKNCHSREIHSLYYLFNYGLLATFFWYATLLLIVWKFFEGVFLKKNVPLLLFFPMVFVLNSLHYSGAESWGVNYLIFCILFLCLNDNKKNELYRISF